MCQEDLQCTKLWVCSLHSSTAWEVSLVKLAHELGKSTWGINCMAPERESKTGIRMWCFKELCKCSEGTIKIKKKLYEKQSPRQGWHSLSCLRGCCTDSCHFSVWVVFLCHRMEPLLAEKSAMCGHESPKDRAGKNRDLLEEALQSTYSKLLMKSVIQKNLLVSCGIMYFSIFCHFTCEQM